VRSVTQRGTAAAIVRDARAELRQAGLAVDSEMPLSPFSKDHVALVVRE
jgi:fibrillarin-like rRNA methylase